MPSRSSTKWFPFFVDETKTTLTFISLIHSFISFTLEKNVSNVRSGKVEGKWKRKTISEKEKERKKDGEKKKEKKLEAKVEGRRLIFIFQSKQIFIQVSFTSYPSTFDPFFLS